MALTADDYNYLKNKHRGGENNSKGAAYEDFYAVYKLATLLFLCGDSLSTIEIKSQVEAFIDDLLIDTHTLKTYYQIKDVKGLTWGYGSGTHTLEHDCELQKELSESNGENYMIRIVFSDAHFSLLHVPTTISSFTDVEFFPTYQSTTQLLLNHAPFKQAITKICSLAAPNQDDLLQIAQVMLGLWCGGQKNGCNLDDFYNQMLSYSDLFLKGFPAQTVSHECDQIFKKYQISYELIQNKLRWSYKEMRGTVIWSEAKDLSITSSKDIWEIIQLLN